MPSDSFNNNSQFIIELRVDKRFISKFGLQEIIYNSELINHPTATNTYANLDCDGTINYPFTFHPLLKKYSDVELNQFLSLFERIARGINKEYHDNILFLSYSYLIAREEKDKSILMDDRLRERGKLLLKFIKVPIPMLNQKNIYKVFHEEFAPPTEKIDQEAIDQNILAYLGLVSGKQEEYFKKGQHIDFESIDNDLWIKLTRQIQRDLNVSVEIDSGKFLTVSRNINLKFNFKQERKASVVMNFENVHQNRHYLKIIVDDLVQEQKDNNTAFYKELIKHDVIIGKNYKLLSSSLGLYNRDQQEVYNRRNLYLKLIEYFNIENILTFDSKPDTNRIRNNFIYQYFILTGLIKKCKPGNKDVIGHLTNEISYFELKKKTNQTFANKSLDDGFKNLKPSPRNLIKSKKGASSSDF